jgi:hypothetical protein
VVEREMRVEVERKKRDELEKSKTSQMKEDILSTKSVSRMNSRSSEFESSLRVENIKSRTSIKQTNN